MSAWLTWRETIPEKWQVVPLRAAANITVSNVDKIPVDNELPVRLCNYTDVYHNEFITSELTFMRGTATPTEIKRFGLQVGDVAITKDSESWEDIGIPALVNQTTDDLVCGYHLAILRPQADTLDGRFLFRCLQAKNIRIQLELVANGITRFGIPKDGIGKLSLPLPPLAQQRAIADFLDRETARLDALLAAKGRWLQLLAEKRRAFITRAVTRGLNPAAPMRDSELGWLDEIPAHWQTNRNAFLFRERDERGYPDLPLLEVSINSGVVLREFSDDKIEGVAADFNSYKVARKGDVAFNKMRMWQGAVGITPTDGLVSPDYTVATPLEGLLASYVEHLFRTSVFSAECCRNSHGIVWDRLRLYWDGFRDIRIPVPPIDEQREIVARIASETARLDALRAATERTIHLLKERRASLIAAAVTGKLAIA